MSYTKEQEQTLRDAAPVSYEDAVAFATEFGTTPRSVISKVKNMELDYVPKAVAPKRPKGMTKSDLVASIEARIKGDSEEEVKFPGLEKATSQALSKLLEAL